jgi:hypothetical protein
MQDFSLCKFDNMEGEIKDFFSSDASQTTFVDCRGAWCKFRKSFSEAPVSSFSCTGQFISWA